MKKQKATSDRDRTKARSWMVMNHLRQRDIQAALGHATSVQVSETLRGLRSDRAVLCYLLEQGCPRSYLALPADMEEAAE